MSVHCIERMGRKGMALLAAGFAFASASHAATLFETTEVVADTASQSMLTVPSTFTVTTPGSYTINLRDLQTPMRLGSLKAIVTRDLKIVGQTEVIYPTGATAPTPASATFDAPAGNYRVHVIGAARAGEAGGAYAVTVNAASGAAAVESAGSIAAAIAPASGQSVLQTRFTITQAGTYQVTLVDRAFPVALTSTSLLLLSDATPVGTLSAPGTLAFTAAAGTYELFVIATAESTANAGLYSIAVTSDPAVSTVYASTQPVGMLTPAALLSVPSAGQYAFTLTDAKFPAALDALSAVIVQDNAVVHSTLAAGATTLNLAAGDLQVYVQAKPTAAAGVGAYKTRLESGSRLIDARVQLADASLAAGTPVIYSFASRSAITAGARRLTVKDFAFPQALSSIKAVVVQGDTVSEIKDGSGTLDTTVRAEPVSVLVAATTSANSTNALFGISLATQSLGASDIESTQGVGELFNSQTVQVATAGRYDLTLADLQFPASLRSAALAVTRGTTLVGQVFGGGSIAAQQLEPGTYVLNFLGQPATTSSFGSYGLKVADSPAVATVTFSASPASLQPGQKTTLTWTATNATTCTASNGWSGVRATSGSVQSDALQATTTFDLTCTGAGGSAKASATVSVVAAKKGGGGAVDLALLGLLMGGLVVSGVRKGRG